MIIAIPILQDSCCTITLLLHLFQWKVIKGALKHYFPGVHLSAFHYIIIIKEDDTGAHPYIHAYVAI